MAEAVEVDVTDVMGLVMSTYANEPCRICRRNIEPKDLRGLVFTGYCEVNGKTSRASHGQCWRDLSATEKADLKAKHLAGQKGGSDG